MSEPAMDPEATAGPSNPKTPPGALSPSPYVPSAPQKSVPAGGFNFGASAKPYVPWGKPPSTTKRQRSDTLSTLPMVRYDIHHRDPTCNYWEQRLAQTVTDKGVDPSQTDFGFIPIILGFLSEIQKDYKEQATLIEDQLDLESAPHSSTKVRLSQLQAKFDIITSKRDGLQLEPLLSPMPPITKRQTKGLEPITRTGPLPPKASGSTPEPPPPPPPHHPPPHRPPPT